MKSVLAVLVLICSVWLVVSEDKNHYAGGSIDSRGRWAAEVDKVVYRGEDGNHQVRLGFAAQGQNTDIHGHQYRAVYKNSEHNIRAEARANDHGQWSGRIDKTLFEAKAHDGSAQIGVYAGAHGRHGDVQGHHVGAYARWDLR